MTNLIKKTIFTTVVICSILYLLVFCYYKDIVGNRIILPLNKRDVSHDSMYFKDQINSAKTITKDNILFIANYTEKIALNGINTIDTIKKKTDTIASYILSQNSRLSPLIAVREASAFLRYSHEYGIPLDLAIGVANTESHFKPEARSNHGSAGVMQVTWRVHYKLLQSEGIMSEKDLHDPALGIKAGCVLISRYIKKHKNVKKAMGRYYGGSSHVYWRRISRNINRYNRYEKARKDKD